MTNREHVVFKELVTGQITWTVTVGSDGYFYASTSADLPDVSGQNFEKLEEACKRHAAKYKIKVAVDYVRFARKNNDTFVAVHGIATGIHGGNGKVLAREGEVMSDGSVVLHSADALTPYTHDVFPPLDEGDEKRVIEINNQLLALQRERNAVLAKYTWKRGFGGTVQDAIDAQVKAVATGE